MRTKLKGERDNALGIMLKKLREMGLPISANIDISKAISMVIPSKSIGQKTTPPIRLSVDMAGNVRAITTAGTFAEGKMLLTVATSMLVNEGVRIDPPRFESHRHETNALVQQIQQQMRMGSQ